MYSVYNTCVRLQIHRKIKEHRLRAERHSQTHRQNQGPQKKTKKRVEALPGTCHMGCLTLEDIDIVEWQVGLECVVV